MKKHHVLFLILIVLTLVVSGCAEAVNVQQCLPKHIYGFWGGLWHGMISPISFIISLFSDNVRMYAVNNNGGWYDFGFCLGAGILFGGSSSSRN